MAPNITVVFATTVTVFHVVLQQLSALEKPSRAVSPTGLSLIPVQGLVLFCSTDPLVTPRRGRDLWSKLRQYVKQTSLADVLSALGAIPSGFRDSTMTKLLTDSCEWVPSYLQNHVHLRYMHVYSYLSDVHLDQATPLLHRDGVQGPEVESFRWPPPLCAYQNQPRGGHPHGKEDSSPRERLKLLLVVVVIVIIVVVVQVLLYYQDIFELLYSTKTM